MLDMKNKIMKAVKSNAGFGVISGIAFGFGVWGYGKLMDRILKQSYDVGFSDGIDAEKRATEFVEKLQDAMNQSTEE
jgi:hypothetical protein